MESQDNDIVVIECVRLTDRFVVIETTFLSIRGISFLGCGSILVINVEQLIIEDTIFQGVEGKGRGTALTVIEVKFAIIITSSFTSNSPGVLSLECNYSQFIPESLNFNINATQSLLTINLPAIGGELATTYSNVSVINSTFTFNKAENGGAVFAYQSNITITQCTNRNNRATTGGVMYTVESLVYIENSTFTNNAADTSISGVEWTIALM